MLAILAVPLAQPVAAAYPVNADCNYLSIVHQFGGVERGNFHVTSVNANLYGDSNRFQPCSNPLLNDASGVSQWVAFESTSGSKREIVQIGMIKCNTSNAQSCNGNVNTLGYFWAWGREDTCGGFGYHGSVDPLGQWLGAVPLVGVPPQPGYHRFQITYSAVQEAIYLYIDGTRRASLSPDQVCWTHGSTNRAGWAVERWDPNDGFGGPGPAWFDDMKYARDYGTLGASPVNFTTGSCSLDAEFYCQVPLSTKVGFYTSQQ